MCKKTAGKGTFKCGGCKNWTHPGCGGYGKREVQKAVIKLTCNSCKVWNLKLIEECKNLLQVVAVSILFVSS